MKSPHWNLLNIVHHFEISSTMKFSPEDHSGYWSWPEWAVRFPSQGLSPAMTRRTRVLPRWWKDDCNYNDNYEEDRGQGGHGWHGGLGSEIDNDGGHLGIEDLAHIDADVEADCFVSQEKSKLPVLQSREGGESYHYYRGHHHGNITTWIGTRNMIVGIIIVIIITICG